MATKKAEALNFEELAGAMDSAGFEDMSMTTMAIPFLRIVQELSPQMKKNKPEYNPDAELGMFVNTVNGKLYQSPIRVVIGKFQHIVLEWGTVRGKLAGMHSPDVLTNPNLIRNEKNQLMDPNTRHTFSECYTYYVLNVDDVDEGVCIIACTSTNIKEAKKLNRNLMHTTIPGTNKRALPYFMVFEVSSVDRSNDDGEWKGISFKFDGFVTKELLDYVVKEREAIPNRRVDYALLEESATSEEAKDVPY